MVRDVRTRLPVDLRYVKVEQIKKDDCAGSRPSLALYIKGQPVQAPQKQIALISYLLARKGRLTPYRQLFSVLSSTRGSRRLHVLRQYMLKVRELLEKHKVRAVIAVGDKAGYALCEIAR